MTTGFGVDPVLDTNGVPVSGTSSQDIRNIWAGLYTPGIVSGGVVTRSATTMTYTVSAGVAAIPTATGEIVMAPIPATTVTTAAAPNTGSRTDIVYVQQKFPSIEGSSDVIVGVASTLPLRATLLANFNVPAGITNTNAATVAGPVDYSLPIGGSLGRLHYWQNKYSGALSNNLLRDGYASFYTPTDRLLKFQVTASLSAIGASGFDNSRYVEFGFLFYCDGGDFVLHTTPGLHQAWATYQYESIVSVGAGTHNVNLGMLRAGGNGQATTHYGVDPAGFGRRGIEFEVWDMGVAK